MRVFFLFFLLNVAFAEGNFESAKYLPVLHEGRVKPLDTFARSSLMQLSGCQTIEAESATEWLLGALMNPQHARAQQIFRIEHPSLLSLIGVNQKKRAYVSFDQLQPYFQQLYETFTEISHIDPKQRDSGQRAVVALWQQISLYLSLENTFWVSGINNVSQELSAYKNLINSDNNNALLEWFQQRYSFLSQISSCKLLPPQKAVYQWQNIGEGLLQAAQDKTVHPTIAVYVDAIAAYQEGNGMQFEKILHKYVEEFNREFPVDGLKLQWEVFYNNFQPFYLAAIFYGIAFLLTLGSWIAKEAMDSVRAAKSLYRWLSRLSFGLFLFAFCLHSLGLFFRMFIEGRPPITNLYSSAIFVGWGTALFSVLLERYTRYGLGNVVGSTIGAMTLLIAHHLSMSGDTLEALRAVLNSNFWLSTHVVIITLGYSATFLSGALASVYIFQGVATKTLSKSLSDAFEKIVYATVCFSAFLTFTGTVLGGFWADQSWGRFWGWDPKENGALLIILWNVLILHAHIGKFIEKRGLMVMAVFGNVITAFSWFGINLLGIGLHSYGFINGTFAILSLFILSQLAIMGMGLLPARLWRSREVFGERFLYKPISADIRNFRS